MKLETVSRTFASQRSACWKSTRSTRILDPAGLQQAFDLRVQ
jgi:hypothetical protein